MKLINLITLICFPFSFVAADTITLDNGSRFEGVIEGYKNSIFSFDISKVKSVSIENSHVQQLNIDNIVYVKLKDGREVSGKLQLKEDNDVNIEVCLMPDSSPIANIETKRDQIKEIQRTPFEVSKNLWDGSISLGGQYMTGNTKKKEIDLLLNASMKNYYHEELKNQIDFWVQLDYLKTQGQLSENDGLEQVTFSHFWTNQWSWYALEKVMYDKPDGVRLRTNVELGLGWKLWDYKNFKVTFRNGLGRIDSKYITNPRSSDGFFTYSPGFLLWAKIQTVYFTSYTDFHIDIGNFNNNLLTSINRLFIPLNTCYDVEMRYEINNNTRPPLGRKPLDTKITLALTYKWGAKTP
ncbi:MAG: DUF481 domain-containing protein [Rhabdochlamydiaceae bacterium]|nr:DUF481 domain-containing protein [Candidatus Amphrikana amoebophyrae]